MNETPNYASLEVCTYNRLIAINNQIRSTRNKSSITELLKSRKQTDKLLSKIKVAKHKCPQDLTTYSVLLSEYKQQQLV